ncbi:MAG: EAL domain-containing protein [Epsilonproteobacteria bacterium]|nr:EAL domain-containing protein [Campylobacterota bacterium]
MQNSRAVWIVAGVVWLYLLFSPLLLAVSFSTGPMPSFLADWGHIWFALREIWEGIPYANRPFVLLFMAANGLTAVIPALLIHKLKYRKEKTKELQNRLERCTLKAKDCQRELENFKRLDPLTQVPNGTVLRERLNEKRDIHSLIAININGFHEINELYRDEAGDMLLKEMADLLQGYFSGKDFDVYRLHSDQFVITTTRVYTYEELSQEISTLLSQIHNHTFTVGTDTIQIGARAGASFDREALLPTAAMALARTKKLHKPFIIYRPELDMSSIYRNNLQWIRKIKKAMEEDRITLYYQPIVNVADNSINYYECLLRLVDEDNLVHAPHAFLDLARRSNLYFDITIRTIDLAFFSFQSHPAHFSINLSYEDIANDEVFRYLIEKVHTFPEPHRIHIEILESEKIENYDVVRRAIQTLHHYGCAISLDDFGSGHANFQHLVNLDFDMLKIDGSLVRNILHDPHSRLIVETIVSFAKKLNLDTCVEYIENREIYETIKAMGVTYMQGYYISKPKPYH